MPAGPAACWWPACTGACPAQLSRTGHGAGPREGKLRSELCPRLWSPWRGACLPSPFLARPRVHAVQSSVTAAAGQQPLPASGLSTPPPTGILPSLWLPPHTHLCVHEDRCAHLRGHQNTRGPAHSPAGRPRHRGRCLPAHATRGNALSHHCWLRSACLRCELCVPGYACPRTCANLVCAR